jgi:hypothetical protein
MKSKVVMIFSIIILLQTLQILFNSLLKGLNQASKLWGFGTIIKE